MSHRKTHSCYHICTQAPFEDIVLYLQSSAHDCEEVPKEHEGTQLTFMFCRCSLMLFSALSNIPLSTALMIPLLRIVCILWQACCPLTAAASVAKGSLSHRGPAQGEWGQCFGLGKGHKVTAVVFYSRRPICLCSCQGPAFNQLDFNFFVS